MVQVDFERIKVYADVGHKEWKVVDAREQFADMIYKNVGGIKAHALALKIYNSEGETEYSPEEAELIKRVAEQLCLPGFIDGLMEQIGENISKTIIKKEE